MPKAVAFQASKKTSWSSLDKEEYLIGLTDNFPIQQNFTAILFKKTTQPTVEWGSYLTSQ